MLECSIEPELSHGNDGFAFLGDGASGAQSMWFLSGRLLPSEPILHVPIHTTPFQVGRSSDLALSLPSKTVSSVHAELTERGMVLELRDLGSTNGTFVNGKRIKDKIRLEPDDLVQFADLAFRVLRQSVTTNSATESQDVCDQAQSLVMFDRLMSERAVVPHYQPLVDLRTQETIGYEVLGRSRIPHLESPAAMFSAAAHLNLERQLSEMFRWKAIQETMSLDQPMHLFLNTHPVELEKVGLVDSIRGLRELAPRQPITLEIHEAAVTNPEAMKELRSALKDMRVALAFDDFGAGQTRLGELVDVHPDYLKFDMSLIRAIDTASVERRRMLATLVQMVEQLGITSLAEGIETEGEFAACLDVGFQLAQGYFFGRPSPLYLGQTSDTTTSPVRNSV